jgi:Flp pilus assembly secretin CpaC
MRYRSFILFLFAIAPGLASGFEPPSSESSQPAAPVLSDAQKQETTALLHKKLSEFMRLQREIRQLCELLQEQQIGLDLQVIEVNETKLRDLGFDWANIKKASTKDSNEKASEFYTALCKNNLAKVIAEPKIMALESAPASFQLDDRARNGLWLNCTPSTLDNGKIRLAVKYKVTRISGQELGERAQVGETTAEVAPLAPCFIAGDSITRYQIGGDKEEISLVFIVKPYLPKR